MRAFAASLLLVVLRLASAAPTPAPLFGINLAVGKTAESKPVSVPQKDITTALVRPALFARAVYCSSPVIKNGLVGSREKHSGRTSRSSSRAETTRACPTSSWRTTKTRTRSSLRTRGRSRRISCRTSTTSTSSRWARTPPLAEGWQGREDARWIHGYAGEDIKADPLHRPVRAEVDRLEEDARRWPQSRSGRREHRRNDAEDEARSTHRSHHDSLRPTASQQQGIGRPRQQDSRRLVHVRREPRRPRSPRPAPVPGLITPEQRDPHHRRVQVRKNRTSQLCPGQENENCAGGNSILDASVTNHRGPYFAKISMGNEFCPL